MTDHENPDRPGAITTEFLELCDRLQLGAGSVADAQRLEYLLENHAHLVDLYVERVHRHAALRWSAGPDSKIGGDPTATPTTPMALPVGEHLAENMPAVCLGSLQQVNSVLATSHRQPLLRHSLRLTMLAAASIAVVGLGVYLLTLAGNHRERVLVENSLVDIGAVDLAEGSVTLRLPQVGYLVAEGESRFTLVSPMRLELDKGRIRVRVTEETGHGFVVATRHGEITDLGTEFGVDASCADSSDLVVFDGAVDLRVTGEEQTPQRFLGGEGARFGSNGELGRIMSIATGASSTFIDIERAEQAAQMAQGDHVILDVRDNIRPRDTKNFYEIVYQGFENRVQAYVDRPYLWGLHEPARLPPQLVNADYVKTFNNDKIREVRIEVKLAAPSDLYLIWDDRVPPPVWLATDFEDSGMRIERLELGVQDMGNSQRRDHYRPCTLWHRRIEEPGWYALGSIGMSQATTGMYGIIAKRPPATPDEPSLPSPKKTSISQSTSKFDI